MAKLTKYSDVLQEGAEFSTEQTPTSVTTGEFEDREGNRKSWVHLHCVDTVLYSNVQDLGIDPEELPTITVKVKNPDNRDWEAMVGSSISVTQAIVVPVIANNQLKGLALSVEAKDI